MTAPDTYGDGFLFLDDVKLPSFRYLALGENTVTFAINGCDRLTQTLFEVVRHKPMQTNLFYWIKQDGEPLMVLSGEGEIRLQKFILKGTRDNRPQFWFDFYSDHIDVNLTLG